MRVLIFGSALGILFVFLKFFRGGSGRGTVSSGFRAGSKCLGIFSFGFFDEGRHRGSSDLVREGLLTGSNARIDLVLFTEPAGAQVGSGGGALGFDGGAFEPMNFWGFIEPVGFQVCSGALHSDDEAFEARNLDGFTESPGRQSGPQVEKVSFGRRRACGALSRRARGTCRKGDW